MGWMMSRGTGHGWNGALRRAASVWTRLLREECGQDLVEYALVAVFVMLGAVASMKSLENKIEMVFTNVGSVLSSAT